MPQAAAAPGKSFETVESLREKYDIKAVDYTESAGSTNLDRYLRIPMVHERRRFTDIMDEEIDDERKKTLLDKYTAGFVRANKSVSSLDLPRRVKHEVASRYAIRDEATAILEEKSLGKPPFLREKPSTASITDGKPLTLTCIVNGDPEPVVQWFKNDVIMGDTSRVSITTGEGRSTLAFKECRDFDCGLYKVVARNNLGQSMHRFRLVLGDIPGPCDSPEAVEQSDTEVMVRWRPPKDDGNCPILCYHLQHKGQGQNDWTSVADNIDHEFFLVHNLKENYLYQFRVAARNRCGWGEFSVSTPAIRTGIMGIPKLSLTRTMQYLQQQTETGRAIEDSSELRVIDYKKEEEPVSLKFGDTADLQIRKYQFIAEIARGRFSLITKCIRNDDQMQFAAKILEKKNREEAVKQEFEVLKSLRHERIVQLFEAYSLDNTTVFMLEQMSGVDVLTYFTGKHEFNEQQVCTMTTQILDALSYLHWRGYCHLDLQPDNILLTSTRRCDVKLSDLGGTQRVSRMGSSVYVNGLLDYMAPEILCDQKAYLNSDIWSLGVLLYVLFSGMSPFKGDDEDETRQNIQCVRYLFEYLFPNMTQESTRFLMLIFKRDPSKRPTVEECRDHRWLAENDFMVRKRERATFFGARLKDYDKSYHGARLAAATKSKDLLNFNGLNFPVAASYDKEIYTCF